MAKRKPGAKKVGGIKRVALPVPERHPAPLTTAITKKLGGVKSPVRRGEALTQGHQGFCPDNCDGYHMSDGYWIHSDTCPHAVMRWKKDGATRDNWRCFDDCDPVEVPSGFTHYWLCPFWSKNQFTPF